MDAESAPFGRNTCHICGGTDFAWGDAIAAGSYPVEFHEDQTGLSSDTFGFGAERLRARVCVRCRNVQLFLQEDKK